MTAKRERRRNRRRREKEEEEEAEEEGNRTNEMFPITGAEEDRSCAWVDLRDRDREREGEKSVVHMQCFYFLATTCLLRMKERDTKRKRKIMTLP